MNQDLIFNQLKKLVKTNEITKFNRNEFFLDTQRLGLNQKGINSSKSEDELLLNLAIKKHTNQATTTKENKIKNNRKILKGTWTKYEDSMIIELVNKFGRAWSKLSKIIITRTGKQIRDRYINTLDQTKTKGKFTEEEDMKLLSLFKIHGAKWAYISQYFKTRTADMVKNRFHSSLKKKLFQNFNNERYSHIYNNQNNIYFHQDLKKLSKNSKEDHYLLTPNKNDSTFTNLLTFNNENCICKETNLIFSDINSECFSSIVDNSIKTKSDNNSDFRETIFDRSSSELTTTNINSNYIAYDNNYYKNINNNDLKENETLLNNYYLNNPFTWADDSFFAA